MNLKSNSLRITKNMNLEHPTISSYLPFSDSS